MRSIIEFMVANEADGRLLGTALRESSLQAQSSLEAYRKTWARSALKFAG